MFLLLLLFRRVFNVESGLLIIEKADKVEFVEMVSANNRRRGTLFNNNLAHLTFCSLSMIIKFMHHAEWVHHTRKICGDTERHLCL